MLSKKSAYVMLEALISAALFLSFSMIIIYMQLSSIKTHDYTEKVIRYDNFLDSLYKNIMYNSDSLCCGKFYINDEDVYMEKLKSLNCNDLLKDSKRSSSYMELEIKYDVLYEIKVRCHINMGQEEKVFESTFCKGDY